MRALRSFYGELCVPKTPREGCFNLAAAGLGFEPR